MYFEVWVGHQVILISWKKLPEGLKWGGMGLGPPQHGAKVTEIRCSPLQAQGVAKVLTDAKRIL